MGLPSEVDGAWQLASRPYGHGVGLAIVVSFKLTRCIRCISSRCMSRPCQVGGMVAPMPSTTLPSSPMPSSPLPASLAGHTVLSLRPVGGHAALRRAAAVHGARVLALSPWRLQQRRDPTTRALLRIALAAPRIVLTSPAAVRAAAALQGLVVDRGTQWFAVGSSTAAALQRVGVDTVAAPGRMDSEGLLALPGLQDVAGTDIGLIVAPGGRDLITTTLQQRGARLLRADVYDRVPTPLNPRTLAALRAIDGPVWLALSSGGALDALLAMLPGDASVALRRARVVAASERLARLAQAHGFADVIIARSARPKDLIQAAVAAHPLA